MPSILGNLFSEKLFLPEEGEEKRSTVSPLDFQWMILFPCREAEFS